VTTLLRDKELQYKFYEQDGARHSYNQWQVLTIVSHTYSILLARKINNKQACDIPVIIYNKPQIPRYSVSYTSLLYHKNLLPKEDWCSEWNVLSFMTLWHLQIDLPLVCLHPPLSTILRINYLVKGFYENFASRLKAGFHLGF